MKLSELCRKIKTSWFLSDFGPFLYCWISCTNKVHHHHLGHISDVLLNITRICPHLNTAWQQNSSVGSFCASSSASAHALFWGKHNHTKYLHFLITFRYTFQLLFLNGKWTQLLSCHFINISFQVFPLIDTLILRYVNWGEKIIIIKNPTKPPH